MVKPIVEESGFKKMISGEIPEEKTMVTLSEIEEAIKAVKKVELNEGMVDLLIKLRRILNSKGITPTDRTYNTCTKILKAQAYLSGRDSVNEDDFSQLCHVLWTDPDHERLTLQIIFDVVCPEKGKIVDYYEKAVEIVDKAIKTHEDGKRIDKGIEAASKIKAIKKEVAKLIEAMEKKGKDTKEAKDYDVKLSTLFNKVFSESIRTPKTL